MITNFVETSADSVYVQEATSFEVACGYANPPRAFTSSDFPVVVKRRTKNSPNALKLFFEDVESQPIVGGREHYLPLIRRVQFKVIWEEAFQNSEDDVVDQFLNRLQTTLSEFNSLCSKYHTQSLDINAVSSQIEPFLDGPSLIMPEALSQSLANHRDMTNPDDEAFVRAGWCAMYLLSMLPPSVRQDPLPAFDESFLADFFKTRLQQAEEAQKTLVSGTLRYITSVAASYIGRGLPYLDLISEGYFGLLRATETFREYMGSHFQSHAATWIHQKIGRALSDQVPIIRQPAHLSEKLRTLNAEVERFQDAKGRIPDEDELTSFDFDDEESELTDDNDEHLAKFKRRRREMFQYLRQMNGPHALLDSVDATSNLDLIAMDGACEVVELEEQFLDDRLWLREHIESAISNQFHTQKPNDRAWQIMQLRVGWDGDEPQTLEEIGQKYNLSRERIRQIEVSTLRKLMFLKPLASHWQDTKDRHEYVLYNAYRRQRDALNHMEVVLGSYPDDASKERSVVEALIEQHIRRARRGQTSRVSRPSYSSLLLDALRQVERPAYYKQVYTKVLEIAQGSVGFSPQAVYAALYTSPHVRSLGNGYFDLETTHPDKKYSTETGEKILLYCPRPMIADAAHPRAFLESALRLQEHLRSGQAGRVSDLIQIETEWAKQPNNTTPQEAIDAWYAAQLIEWIDYQYSPQASVTFILQQPLKMQELRMWCLISLCTRIVKTFDALAILNRVTSLTTQEIQKLLFGIENKVIEVRNRLEMLAAFDAVREERNTWTITDIGREIVSKWAEADLPDLEALNSIQPDPELVDVVIDDDLDVFEL